MEARNVMKLYAFQNKLLILDYKTTFQHGNSFMLLYIVALMCSSKKLLSCWNWKLGSSEHDVRSNGTMYNIV